MRTDRGHRLQALGLLGLALAAAGAPARPDDERRWQVEASYAAAAVDNLLRLPDANPPADGLSRDDRQTSAALSAAARLDLGRQQLRAEATLRDERFARNPRFNHLAHALSLSLDAATVGSLSGRLAASHRQSLAPFDGADTVAQSESSNENPIDLARELQASARLGTGGLLSIGVHGAWQDLQTTGGASAAAQQQRQQRQRRGGLVVEANPHAGTRLALSWTGAVTAHPLAVGVSAGGGERIRSQSTDLHLDLQAGGTLRLAGLLRSGRSRHALEPWRDFEGQTGNFGVDWRASAKTGLGLRWVQDHGQHRLGDSGLRKLDDTCLERRWELQARHTVSAALSLDARLIESRRELARTLPGNALLQGQERSRSWRVGLSWSPAERWSLACHQGQESRTGSGALGTALRASITSCRVDWRLD